MVVSIDLLGSHWELFRKLPELESTKISLAPPIPPAVVV